MLLTIAEIARQLGLPESTARYYRDRFTAYVPEVGTGRRRRYQPEALAVLRLVAEGMRADQPVEAIEVELRGHFPLNGTATPQQRGATAQQQPSAMLALPEAPPALLALIDQQRTAMETMAGELTGLRAEVARLAAAIELKTPKAKVSPPRRWWQRWRG